MSLGLYDECLHELGYNAHIEHHKSAIWGEFTTSHFPARHWEDRIHSEAYTLEHLHCEWQRLACKPSQATSSNTS